MGSFQPDHLHVLASRFLLIQFAKLAVHQEAANAVGRLLTASPIAHFCVRPVPGYGKHP